LTGTQRRAATTLAAVLAAFAALILLAAAANVGGLFLAAFAGERGRAAIQLAIGSGRGAVVRRHVIEGAIIGAASGVVAVAVYAWIRLQLAQVAILPTLSLRLDLSLDWRVIGAVIAAGTTVGALLSLAPALWVIQLDLATALRDGAGRISAGTELSRTRRLLVAIQIAVSIALVAGAALFSRSVDALDRVDVGFERHGLFAMDFDVEPSVASPAMLPALAREALERTAAVPGVTATAMANRAPIDVSTPQLQIALPAQQGATPQDVTVYEITERYFETVGLPIVHGRAFTAAEVDRSADLIIVNQTLAARLWPNGDVLDRALVLPSLNRTVRVIGVARDSRYRSLSEPPSPHVYRPIRPAFSLALLVRTRDDPRRAIRAVQEVLDRVGPGVVGFFPRTLDDHLAIDMLTTKAAARASTTLGAFALLLSAAGLYGIVAWFVAVRRREIAVRMALGASAADVRWLVVRQAVAAAAPGLIIGWTIAIGLTAFGGSLFVGVGSLDPNSLLLGGAALVLIVIAASYWPSRKATQVDPVIALRDS
jgi:predicted permease